MIQVKVETHGGFIEKLEVSGHAGFAEAGQDLVCAGASCIMYGTYNALDELRKEGFSYKLKEDGYFLIQTKNTDEITQTILKTAIIQLETMHISYANYIKIKKTEV